MNTAALVRSLRAIERTIVNARLSLPPCDGPNQPADRKLFDAQLQTLRLITRVKGGKPRRVRLTKEQP
jgi:hypothetical protein